MYLLNTCIVPWFDGPFVAEGKNISLEEAREVIKGGFVSCIGHQAAADTLSQLLGVRVPMDRKPWDGSGKALCFQSHVRLEEGKIYSEEEMGRLRFGFRLLEVKKA